MTLDEMREELAAVREEVLQATLEQKLAETAVTVAFQALIDLGLTEPEKWDEEIARLEGEADQLTDHALKELELLRESLVL